MTDINEKYITYLENNSSVKLGEQSVRQVVETVGLGPFTQYLKILEIHPLDDYKLWCRIVTDEIKIFDMSPYLNLPIYRHLKEKSIFDDVTISDLGVPCWMDANGIDRDTNIGISFILINGT